MEPITGTFYSAATERRLALADAAGRQTLRTDGVTLPARRDGDEWLNVPILITGLRIKLQSDGIAPTAEECGSSLGAMEYALVAIGPALWEEHATMVIPAAVSLNFQIAAL